MKKALLLIITFSTTILFGQNRKNQFVVDPTSESHTIYIRFKSNQVDYSSLKLNHSSPLTSIFETYNIGIKNGLRLETSKLNELEKNSISLGNGNQSIQLLKNIYQLEIQDQSAENLIKIAQTLESFDEVEYVSFIQNKPIEPPFIKNISTTPDLESFQGYLDETSGINARYAWSIGVTGQNIDVIDIEYGLKKGHEMLVNLNHVQLESKSINPLLSDPSSEYHSYLDHGTSVASILASTPDKIGITGTASGIKSYTNYLEWTSEGYDRIAAVTRAINNSTVGTIIMYEMQDGGQNNGYVPAEYNNVIWDLTKAATDAGIIIIAAAGNGSQNLDADFYIPYMNRGNSGAIIVGAGSSNTNHSKLNFSTYGSRLDLQGWGENVMAAGYGYYATYDNDPNRTYILFSGTSSATPIVASAAILVQSYYFLQTGKYLTPSEMRKLLVTTAIPQGGNTAQNIGPFPNVKAAIENLNKTLNITDQIEPLSAKIFPNPTNNILNVSTKENNNLSYEIFNLTGQLILKGNTKEQIQVGHLSKGTYIIKISDGKRLIVEKFIKN